jgi:hypothetical protein
MSFALNKPDRSRQTTDSGTTAKLSLNETLLTDLTADPGRLWSAISPTTRNNINAATAKLAYEVTYFDGDPPAACYEFLAHFSAQRGFWTPPPSYYKKHMAHGTVACALLDGEMAVLHFYLHDPGRRRVHLLWSARSLTGRDRAHERAVSKLNRLLHWRDLLHFKNEGVATYDWGGISPGDPAMRGLNDFKRQFGGIHVTEWEVAWRSPLYAPLRKLARSVKTAARRHANPPLTANPGRVL